MIAYKFIGEPGSFVVGLPARDIQEVELTPELRQMIEENIATPGAIYEQVVRATKQKAPQEDSE